MVMGDSGRYVRLTTMLNKDKTGYPQFGWEPVQHKYLPPPKKKQKRRYAHIVQAHNQAR